MYSKQSLMNKALLAKKLHRPHDMVVAMKQVALTEQNLNPSEMKMLSNAYKGVYKPLRTAIDTLDAFRSNYNDKLTTKEQNMLTLYMNNITEEMRMLCREMLVVLNTLVPGDTWISEENESNIRRMSLKADFLRYLAEITVDADAKRALANAASECYQFACNISRLTMTDLDPARLGAILNYCVLLDSILQEPAQACQLAQDTLFDAEDASQYGGGPPSGKSVDILTKFKTNLPFWASNATKVKNREDGSTTTSSSGSSSASD